MFCFYEYKYTIAWYGLQEALIRVRKRGLIYIYMKSYDKPRQSYDIARKPRHC